MKPVLPNKSSEALNGFNACLKPQRAPVLACEGRMHSYEALLPVSSARSGIQVLLDAERKHTCT